jgi:hypothetical protein
MTKKTKALEYLKRVGKERKGGDMRRTAKIPDPSWEDIHDRDNIIIKLCDGVQYLINKTYERNITPEERDDINELMVDIRRSI